MFVNFFDIWQAMVLAFFTLFLVCNCFWQNCESCCTSLSASCIAMHGEDGFCHCLTQPWLPVHNVLHKSLPWLPVHNNSIMFPLFESRNLFKIRETLSEPTSKVQGDSESCQKLFPTQSSEISYIYRHVIPQKNWQTSQNMWLKGFSHTVTYSKDISCPSWHTNCGTPCRLHEHAHESRGWQDAGSRNLPT